MISSLNTLFWIFFVYVNFFTLYLEFEVFHKMKIFHVKKPLVLIGCNALDPYNDENETKKAKESVLKDYEHLMEAFCKQRGYDVCVPFLSSAVEKGFEPLFVRKNESIPTVSSLKTKWSSEEWCDYWYDDVTSRLKILSSYTYDSLIFIMVNYGGIAETLELVFNPDAEDTVLVMNYTLDNKIESLANRPRIYFVCGPRMRKRNNDESTEFQYLKIGSGEEVAAEIDYELDMRQLGQVTTTRQKKHKMEMNEADNDALQMHNYFIMEEQEKGKKKVFEDARYADEANHYDVYSYMTQTDPKGTNWITGLCNIFGDNLMFTSNKNSVEKMVFECKNEVECMGLIRRGTDVVDVEEFTTIPGIVSFE